MALRPVQRFAAVLLAFAAVLAIPSVVDGVDGGSEDGEATERSRAVPTTTTTDPSTLRGYPYYRATVTAASAQVFAAPDAAAPVTHDLPTHNEHGIPQTFLVTSEQRDAAGDVWYHVLLPVRPNGSTGWVRGSDVLVEGLHRRVVVYLTEFRLEVWKDEALERTFDIGVGTDETPTPGGEYYVKEVFELTRDNSAYGSHALGLSGYSNVLTDWRGGGIIGIHGTNRPESIGTRASHGCIRMRNEDVAQLVTLAPRGTPVAIVA